MPALLLAFITLLAFFCGIAAADCVIFHNNLPLAKKNHDAVTLLLDKTIACPQSIQGFKRLLTNNSLQTVTSLVANRGKNNPHLGSFSFFESVSGITPEGFRIDSGELFLGHFTTLDAKVIHLDQRPEKNKLLIELIAWDKQSRLFNFYELRGLNKVETRWYYRGNSADALQDNRYLYRKNPSQTPKFGSRMRCSACHNAGTPIMKEIKMPHNDWWTRTNPLIFLPNHPDNEVNALLQTLSDAQQFSQQVHTGINKLHRSVDYQSLQQTLSLQEQLRPLFCTNEINIESDNMAESQDFIAIPSAFWLNPLLGELHMTIPAPAYQNLLTTHAMQFPETNANDADHAWLTPVKGVNDLKAIRQLLKDRKITAHFAYSVLMIDYSHPLFSPQRCELLTLLPAKPDSNWTQQFIQNLQQAQSREASLLAAYLSNSEKYSIDYFHHILSKYKNTIRLKILSETGLQEIFLQLIAARRSVAENELSQNPLGQILEPGFRVIFPVPAVSD